MGLTTTYIQKLNKHKNLSSIDFRECEYKLKDEYNISKNDSLYILKLDVEEKGMKIPKIEYELYYPFDNNELSVLNLSFCLNNKIDIFIPVPIDNDINKHNPKSDYYNNICSKSKSEFNTDITLRDRKNIFIDKNLTLCEEDCTLIDYNYISKKVKCSCKVKIKFPLIEEIKFNKTKLAKSFTDINNIMNIKIVKCYKEVFNKELLKNYGFYILLSINIFFYICFILFYSKYYYVLKYQIEKIIESKEIIISSKKNKSNKSNNNNTLTTNNNKKKKNQKKSKRNKVNIMQTKFITIKSSFSLIKSNKKINEQKKYYKTDKSQKKFKKSFNNNNINNNNNIKIHKEKLKYNDLELDKLPYDKALVKDKRTFSQYYISLINANNAIFFSFYCGSRDHNSQIIKIFLFFFFFALHITINALFFNDNTIHKIYIDEGEFYFIYQLPQILYSSIISGAINALIKYLSLSQENVLKIKLEKTLKSLHLNSDKIFRILKLKFAIYFFITFLLLLSFLYYLSCFCGIYINNQIHLIKDSIISFSLSFNYPFFIYLIPSIFRICALRAKNKNKNCLYRLSTII